MTDEVREYMSRGLEKYSALYDTSSPELEEARAYACSLLDRLWSLGHELERVRIARSSDVEASTVQRWLAEWLPHVPAPANRSTLSDCTEDNPCEVHDRLGLDW